MNENLHHCVCVWNFGFCTDDGMTFTDIEIHYEQRFICFVKYRHIINRTNLLAWNFNIMLLSKERKRQKIGINAATKVHFCIQNREEENHDISEQPSEMLIISYRDQYAFCCTWNESAENSCYADIEAFWPIYACDDLFLWEEGEWVGNICRFTFCFFGDHETKSSALSKLYLAHMIKIKMKLANRQFIKLSVLTLCTVSLHLVAHIILMTTVLIFSPSSIFPARAVAVIKFRICFFYFLLLLYLETIC